MSEKEAERKLSDEEKRIKAAARNVLPELGHNNLRRSLPKPTGYSL